MSSAALQKSRIAQWPIKSEGRDVILNAQYMIDIPEALDEWDCKRTVLVVSKSLNQNTDKVSQLEERLGLRLVGKHVGVGSHSPYADVLTIAKLLHSCRADSLVCIGSSSYTDAAKIARLLHIQLPSEELTEDGMEKLIDQEKGGTRCGALKNPEMRLILLPCSLSVAEYNPVGSATNSQGKKQHFGEFRNPATAADLILLDPEIAATAPEDLWLISGARAVDHCIETIVSANVAEEGLVFAFRGLRAIVRGLGHYKELIGSGFDSSDNRLLKSISDCQLGARHSMLGVLCYGSNMGPSHAIGHQVGSVAGVAHGMTSCLCLPATLRYEKEHPDSKHWRVDKHADVVNIFNEEFGWSETDAGDAVERFYRKLGLPARFTEIGITNDEVFEKIAVKTLSDYWGGGERQADLTAISDILKRAR